MTKCPSTTDVVVNCGTRRVSIQYFSSALYGRVFFVFLQFSRLQFPVFMHFPSCAIYSEWQTWENNFQVFGLALSLLLIKLPSLCCQVQQLTTFMSVQQQQQQPAEYLKFMLLLQSCQMLPPCAKFHSLCYRIQCQKQAAS